MSESRDQRGEPFEQGERLEYDVRRTVAMATLERPGGQALDIRIGGGQIGMEVPVGG